MCGYLDTSIPLGGAFGGHIVLIEPSFGGSRPHLLLMWTEHPFGGAFSWLFDVLRCSFGYYFIM